MSASSASSKPSVGARLLRTVKGFLLWRHERASWQYDVMVALILLFVFLTPARFFHDQPVYNPHLVRDVVQLETGPQGTRYRVSAELLASYHSDPQQAAERVFARNLDYPFTIARIEPVRSEGSPVVWYDVWLREQDDPASHDKVPQDNDKNGTSEEQSQ